VSNFIITLLVRFVTTWTAVHSDIRFNETILADFQVVAHFQRLIQLLSTIYIQTITLCHQNLSSTS